VLSLLWLAGLGSILAVIFGIKARNSIARSQGRETGDGLALAGLIVGIMGFLGAVLSYGVLIVATHTLNTLTTPQAVALGHSLNVSASDSAGIRTVNVYSVSDPVTGANGQPNPSAGREYAAADVQVCATSSGSQTGPDALFFHLLFRDGQSVGVDPIDTKLPSLLIFSGIGANQCVRGYLTFEIAAGTVPTTLQYWPDPFHKYEWMLTR